MNHIDDSIEYKPPGLLVEQYRLEATHLPAHFQAEHLLILHQGIEPVRSHRQHGTAVEEVVFQAGDAGLYPAGERGFGGWDGPVDVIQVHVDALALENHARQGLDLTSFTLQDRFCFQDGLLTGLGRQLLAAAGAEHALGRLYGESLANTLHYHLIAHHGTFERRIAAGRNLSAPVLARIDAFLEAAVEQSVTVEALASLANLSVFHFARCFKQTTGYSPYQYVLKWKIRRAQLLLRAGDLPLAAISDALGFASPAHFSAAFKRALGQSPRAFQQS
ncbi:helix-turn-helix transcriptional regulator [Hymenobacter terrestris]|uniref:Helix-turn-helix transcriptional regulator n=1 Tax=Hymenobacter terrestris TaxID=2748310 RepID=A0ABX2Q0J7_9BACT|nr:helix-turn-helix transcriptional regulator [Hymenobacter terrestris]NVO84470.1 helix-turn-helix transcriptional regulator [Hymenobacter terrestris]